MTESEIEERVERRTNYIDALYMAGQIDSQEYDARMAGLNDWAEDEYRKLPLFGYVTNWPQMEYDA